MKVWPRLYFWYAVVVGSFACLPALADEPDRESLAAQRTALHDKYVSLLNKRLETSVQNRDDTKAILRWASVGSPGRNYLFAPQTNGQNRPAKLEGDASLQSLQRFYAENILNLAQQALEDGDRARAYTWANEALRADPGSERANRVIAAADQQQAQVKTVSPGWKVETKHFEITTNHDEASALAVGEQLEELHAVWRQMFANYWFTQAELERRFDRQPSRLNEPNHKVMLFANKQQYVDHLKRDEPGIAVSLGYYAEKSRTAYFYADDETLATQFHEATHQLFHERLHRGRPAGVNHNFWVVEGIATYMESLQKGDGYFVVGGPTSYRLQFARYRALTEEYYVSLAELVAMGRADMKSAGDQLPRLYSQSAGLAHFFMDGQGGKYRAAFVQYLDAVYRDKADAATLARLTGERYEQLDREYIEFLRIGDEELASLIPGENAPRLYLGKTRITDESMKQIASVSGLQWLDVGYCEISDFGIKSLAPRESLLQLNLERTNITDEALTHIAKMSSLQNLDLSGCRISDDGLRSLAELETLEVLWLTGTPVTDAGLKHLHGLKTLKFVDVEGTSVTAEGFAALRRAVPGVSSEQ